MNLARTPLLLSLTERDEDIRDMERRHQANPSEPGLSDRLAHAYRRAGRLHDYLRHFHGHELRGIGEAALARHANTGYRYDSEKRDAWQKANSDFREHGSRLHFLMKRARLHDQNRSHSDHIVAMALRPEHTNGNREAHRDAVASLLGVHRDPSGREGWTAVYRTKRVHDDQHALQIANRVNSAWNEHGHEQRLKPSRSGLGAAFHVAEPTSGDDH